MIGPRRILNEIKALDSKFDLVCDLLATIHHTASNRKARNVVAIEFNQDLVREINDWSEPIQVRFQQQANGEYTMEIRSCKQLQETIAARAARQ